ncbi:MAG: glycosyltransferase family 2 protein, partial [Elusimicrobia bacterium]|nr:glycosyltransferase family 2 protein [Elusimicrobiota bacterium]
MSEPVHLSIVIPAFNEAGRLGPTLDAIEAFRRSRRYTSEVIVVDDCSLDGTARLAEMFAAGKDGYRILKNERNLGKGGAVRRGLLEARGAYRLFTDADLSTPIEQVDSFFPFFDGTADGTRYDIVIGSRRVRGARLDKRQPIHRESAGRLYSLLVRLLALRGFLDTQCGFKMFTARAAEEVCRRQTVTGFGFDVELLYIAVKVLRLK